MSKAMLNAEQLENGTSTDKIITLRGVFKTKQSIQPCFDPATRWYKGVERLSEEQKKDRTYYVVVGETGEKARLNTTVVLEDGIEFDLNQEVDRINWEWIKECKEVAMSFKDAHKSKLARYYVQIEGREARESNIDFDTTFKAASLVMNDSRVDYEDRALLLGHDMTGEDPELIKQFLLSKANNIKTAKQVISIYTSNSLSIQLLYLKAKKKNIITKTPSGAYKYGAHVISMSEEGCIVYLQDPANKEVLDLLERDVNPDYFKKDIKKEVSKPKSKEEPKEEKEEPKEEKEEPKEEKEEPKEEKVGKDKK